MKTEQWTLSDLIRSDGLVCGHASAMACSVYVFFLACVKSSGAICMAGTSLQSFLFVFGTFIITLDKLILARVHWALPGNTLTEISSTLKHSFG